MAQAGAAREEKGARTGWHPHSREADGEQLEKRRKTRRTSWERAMQERRDGRCPELERAHL